MKNKNSIASKTKKLLFSLKNIWNLKLCQNRIIDQFSTFKKWIECKDMFFSSRYVQIIWKESFKNRPKFLYIIRQWFPTSVPRHKRVSWGSDTKYRLYCLFWMFYWLECLRLSFKPLFLNRWAMELFWWAARL